MACKIFYWAFIGNKQKSGKETQIIGSCYVALREMSYEILH